LLAKLALKKIFTTGILLLLCNSLQAQPLLIDQHYSVKKLSQQDGLSQGSNYFAYEDREGFMWITANDALNRYDGNWVKVYKNEKYFKRCPPLKQGYNFTEDAAGNIYIGSTIGLYCYNRKHDDFSLLNIFKDEQDGNCVPFTYRDNKIWCYNRFYKIAAYDITTQKIVYYDDVKLDSIESFHPYMFSTTNYRCRQPFFDKQNILWIASHKMLASYNISNRDVEYYVPATGNKFLPLDALYYDSSFNRILFGTDSALVVFTIPDKKFIYSNALNTVEVEDILKLKKLYIIQGVQGILCISEDSLKFNSSFSREIHQAIKDIITYPVCIDRFNRIWFCKSGFGLTVVDLSNKTFFKEEGTTQDPFYFNSLGVHSFAEYPNGDILICCGGNLFIQHHLDHTISVFEKTNRAVRLATPLCNDDTRNGIWTYTDKKLQLLSCTTNKEMFSVDCDDTRFGSVQDITVLPDDSVWVSLSTGIYKIDFTNKNLVPIKSLARPNAFKLNLIDKNRIAISYLNGDMLIANTNTETVLQPILHGVKCFYMQQDTNKNIFWVGADDGVYMLDKNFKLLKKINALDGLSGSYIYGLLLDDENNVWVSHEKGLSYISSPGLKIINYDEDDNIQDNDYNNRCFFKAKDGTLYFGGIKGFNWFKPPVIIPSFYKPQLYVDEIKVNNKSLFEDTNYDYIEDLNLSANQNKIAIHAVVKDLDMISSNEIIYRFKNLDSAWQHLPANSNIIFNNLAAGNYQLELGYYNKKQSLIHSQKILNIHISLHFYQSILFWVIVSAGATAFILWWYNKARIKNKTRRYEQQIALLKERTRITTDLHDDVGSALSSLQIHTAIIKQVMDKDPEKAKEYLDKIIEQSSEISGNVSDIIWSMKPDKDRLIDIDGRIRNTVSNLLGATTIDYSMTIEKDLESIAKNITARKNIVLIIKEATNNCAKYSEATKYNLVVKAEDNFLTIIISDNGKGIPEYKIQSGNGLQNMRKRAEELKGTMEIETANGKGTQLKFTLPLTEIRG
jgi:signal transduction histidine kinase/ligand-binding sensor domain-containing protein